jgi:hypothetical protein
MAGITLTQAQAHLEAWLAADLAVARGQSYTIGTRTMTRANAKEIAENIARWQRWVQQLSRGQGGLRVRYAVT